MAKTRMPGITVAADGQRMLDKAYRGVRIVARLGRVSQRKAERWLPDRDPSHRRRPRAEAVLPSAVRKLPVIVACYTLQKLRWHIRATDVPARWWLRSKLDDDSFAYELLTKGKIYPAPRKQPGEVWFENDDAEKYEILEHCNPMANDEVLVLLI
jgi:hypothetical protein